MLWYCRYWANENPHWYIDNNIMGEQSVMVWAGLIDENIIGPFFFGDQTVRGESYLEMLQNQIVPALRELNYDPLNIVFQQDGAPPHFRRIVTDWLDNNMPNWIGRGGPVLWPPRSPDLTRFFCLELHKEYCLPHTTRIDMNLFKKFKMLHNVHEGVIRRINACIDAGGGHFESSL